MPEDRVVIVARAFSPDNTGFANAASALFDVLSRLENKQVSVVTLTKKDGLTQEGSDKIYRAREKYPRFNRSIGLLTTLLRRTKFLKKLAVYLRAWGNDWILYRTFKKNCSSPPPSCIIFETNVFPFMGPKVLSEYGARVAFRLHSTEDMELLYFSRSHNFKSLWIKKRVLKFCSKVENVLSTNSYHIKFFQEKILGGNPLEVWSKKYSVIPNAVKSMRAENMILESIDRVRGKYALFLGKLSPEGWHQKGLSDLVEAISLNSGYSPANLRSIPEDLSIVVVGQGVMEKEFLARIKTKGVEKHFLHIKKTNREETAWLLYNASFVVLPSRFEGQSMFLTEALSLGKPIITTIGTGASDLVSNKNGLLVPVGDSGQLREAILDLWLMRDPELQEMGGNSIALFESAYTPEAVAKIAEQELKRFLYRPT